LASQTSTTCACGPPGDHVWCEGSYDGALFNEGWEIFSNPWT
jgi:hypothetical protein